MSIHDRSADRQSDPHALSPLRREEGIKNPIPLCSADARTFIFDFQYDAAFAIEFTQIFERTIVGPPSRPLLVASFLAILELARLALVRLYQGADEAGCPRGPIHLRRAVEHGDQSWTEQISDLM